MYEVKNDSSARTIIVIICVIVAVAAIAVGANVIIDHAASGGAGAKEACENRDGLDTLNKAGVFGESGGNCETETE